MTPARCARGASSPRDSLGWDGCWRRTVTMAPERRVEYGSDLHWVASPEGTSPGGPRPFPWPVDSPLFGSGRDALRVLVDWGMRERGWRRIWLPSYYCQEVPAALRSLDSPELRVCAYADSLDRPQPALEGLPIEPHDIVVVANQLGLRRQPNLPVSAENVEFIEDHSHDLAATWAMHSRAHYAFASLRKTLPLPDGGVAWSPRGLPLPPEPELTDGHASAALARLSGMILKGQYLAGAAVPKATYLAEARCGAD